MVRQREAEVQWKSDGTFQWNLDLVKRRRVVRLLQNWSGSMKSTEGVRKQRGRAQGRLKSPLRGELITDRRSHSR